MTKTPENDDKGSKKSGDNPASGRGAATIGAAIGSAAIAAALLYAGRRFSRKTGGEPTASGMKDTVPSGEQPETD